MSERVIAHPVLVRDYLVKQSVTHGITEAAPKHEEGSFDATLSQDGQNRLCDARRRAVIKRKRNFLHCPCTAQSSGKSAGAHQMTSRAEPGYPHLDDVTLCQIRLRLHAEANARRCSGYDETSRTQCNELAAIADDRIDIEYHIGRIIALAGGAIHIEREFERPSLSQLARTRQPRADRRECEALAVAPLTAPLDLPTPLGHVVDHDVTGNAIACLVIVDARGGAAHDNPELDLPVGIDRARRQENVLAGSANRRSRFKENHGLGRDWQVGFRRMLAIIQPNSDDFLDVGKWRADPFGGVDPW